MPVNVAACSGESRMASPAEHASQSPGSDPLAVRTINLSWISILSSFLRVLPMIFLPDLPSAKTWEGCLKVRLSRSLSDTLTAAVVRLIIDIAYHSNLERPGEQVNNHYGLGRSARSGKPACAPNEPEDRVISTRSTTLRWWI